MKVKVRIIFFNFLILIIILPVLYWTISSIIDQITFVKNPVEREMGNLKYSIKILNSLSSKKILTFDQANLYRHTKLNYLSYLDPRLVTLYKLDLKHNVYEKLRELDIEHIFIADFIDPVFINSKLANFVGDARYSQLISQKGLAKIYKIFSKKKIVSIYFYKFIHKKNILKNNYPIYLINKKNILKNTFFSKLINYCKKYILFFGVDYKDLSILINNAHHNLYQMHYEVLGKGLYHVYLIEFDDAGKLIQIEEIWQDVLKSKFARIDFQFLLNLRTRTFKLVISPDCFTNMSIQRIKLNSVEYLK